MASVSSPMSKLTAAASDREPASSSLQCCCGRPDCLVLKKNCSVLESVEKDVHTAAQLGQALLTRHEAYMADAERDRLDLTFRIEKLEMDKQELEAANAAKIEENRNLLDQLENLNNNVVESDTKIRSLEASLLTSMQTVRRLESSSARAADAERHLAMLEEDQEKLHQELRATREDARTQSQRSKEAQRNLTDIQDQLDRIEREAQEERDRHADVLRRMERQREVDKQLDVAAGRLKGAAASKNMNNDSKTGKVINNFVRDLLQDNATLQLGIAELREMLMNSNDEIQSLRDKIDYQQPTTVEELDSPASTLRAELEPHLDDASGSNGPSLSQELHIHHHYHVTPSKEPRRLKKKRQGLLPGVLTPSQPGSVASSRHNSGQWALPSSPTAPALLSHDMDTTPTMSKPPNHWPDFSNPPSEFSSSVPGSPRLRGASSVFDQSLVDSSDPVTSPTTSFDPMSPTWRASHNKRPSVTSTRSFQSLSLLDSEPDLPPHKINQSSSGSVIIEEDENEPSEDDGDSVLRAAPSDIHTEGESEISVDCLPQPRRQLHRTASHESIMSLSGGLDIHTLQMRPSQMSLRPLGGADAVVTGVTAQPTLSRVTTKRSDAALRDTFIGFQSPRTVSSPLSQGSTQTPQSGSRLRSWAGWRPWGGNSSSPPKDQASSPSAPAAPLSIDAIVESADSDISEDTEESQAPVEQPQPDVVTPKRPSQLKDLDWGRSPGINQPGAIPAFQQYWASQKRKGAPAKVTAESIDRDALTEILEGHLG